MEMTHPSGGSLLPSAAPTREGDGSPPSSSGEQWSCSLCSRLLAEMPSRGAGWSSGVAPWPSRAVTHLSATGVCGFVHHLRENKRVFRQGKDKSSPSPLQQPPAQGLGRVQ